MYEVISERPIVEILCFISFRNINSGIKFAIFFGGGRGGGITFALKL